METLLLILAVLTKLGFNLQYLVAGFSGGIVCLIFVQTDRSRAAVGAIGGALTANFLAQPVFYVLSKQLGVTMPPTAELGGAFICGLCAIKIVNGIYNRGKKFEASAATLSEDDTANKGA